MLDTWLVTVPTELVVKNGATTTVVDSTVVQDPLLVESPLVVEIVPKTKSTPPSWLS